MFQIQSFAMVAHFHVTNTQGNQYVSQEWKEEDAELSDTQLNWLMAQKVSTRTESTENFF